LRNKLNIRDAAKLGQIEARIVGIRDVELAMETVPGTYNIEHLMKIHNRLFGDIYDWAGKARTVDISKPGSQFCHWRFVEEQASAALAELALRGYLIGFNKADFTESLAYFYGELNAVHPFREGNGRSLRAFLRQLGAAAGYMLDWSELSETENIEACRRNLQTTDTSELVRVLGPVVRQM
jgi:cell filamentation protein